MPVLGKFPLPVEVIPMARSLVARQIRDMTGGQPTWREGVVTDNGNQILDIHNLQITDPEKLERELNQLPGVVCVGLFARRRADDRRRRAVALTLPKEPDDVAVAFAADASAAGWPAAPPTRPAIGSSWTAPATRSSWPPTMKPARAG